MPENDQISNFSDRKVQDRSLDLFGDIDFQKFRLIVQKSLIWIILIIAVSVLSSYLYIRYTVPIYESSSTLKLEMKNDVDALGIPGMQAPATFNNLSGEIELLKSDLIYEQVIEELGDLGISYYSKGRIKDEERFRNSLFEIDLKYIHPDLMDRKIDIQVEDERHCTLKYNLYGKSYENRITFEKPFKNDHFSMIMHRNFDSKNQFDQDDFYIVVNSKNALLSMIEENLVVRILNPTANTLNILYQDPNPLKAKAIVDCVNRVYLKNTLELKNQASKQTINFLNEQLQRTEEKLAESERQLEAFVAENKTNSIRDIYTQSLSQIKEIDKEIHAINLQLNRLSAIQDAFEKGDTLSYHSLAGSSKTLSEFSELMDRILQKKNELKALQYTSNSNTLAFQYLQNEIQSMEKTLQKSTKDGREMLLSELEKLETEKRIIEKEVKNLPEKETEYNRLKRLYDLNEKFYLLLIDKKAEFGISEAGTIPDFQVLSPANLPGSAVFPKKMDVYLIGVGGGIVLSLLLIGIRFITNNTIDSVEEIERVLNVPILGVVPFHKSKSRHSKMVVTENPKSELAEAIRSIRTNLDFMAPESGKSKILSITSTISSEGKTFVSVNLGAVISMSNQKVILLDLDMRKPKLHLALDSSNDYGMSNLLIGRMELDEVIRKTLYDNLDYISSGPPPPNPSELILLPEMDEIIEKLGEKYDVIIMDSPPIGLVTDGIILMKKADIPVYILKAEYSKKGFLKSIGKLQQQKGINHLSLILNGFKRRNQSAYGYGYGYGYGYEDQGYYEDKDKKRFFGLF
jgi:capsular exopolysaccharide synthesis family protein